MIVCFLHFLFALGQLSGKEGQGKVGGAKRHLHEKVGRLVEILERNISARSMVV